MKNPTCVALCGLLVAVSLSAACNSAGHQKADSTAMHMDEMRAAVVSLKGTVEAVASSLAQVIEQAEVDPKTAFDDFRKRVSAMKDGLARVESEMKSMKKQGQTYFAEWEKQSAAIQDADLKRTAEERRAKLSAAIDTVDEAMTAARAETTPFATAITDVQTYLGSDLTPAGIKSVKDKSKMIRKAVGSIGDKLDDVVEALEEGAPEFKTAKPPPPPAPEKKG